MTTRSRVLARPGDGRDGWADPERDWLTRVAGYGLTGARPLLPAPDDTAAFAALVRAAERERVLGLLAAAVHDGALAVDEAQRSAVADAHEGWCAHDVRLERTLRDVADALDQASVPFRLVKGPALAHRCYADPAQRVFADLDLIVAGPRLREASTVLARAVAAEPVLPELRPGFDERFGKETLLRSASTPDAPAGLEIDVHRTPVAGALGLAVPVAELLRGDSEILLGGRAIPIVSGVPALLVACYQATVADRVPRLAAARDLVALVLTDAPEPVGVVATAGRWQARAVVAAAVTWSVATLDLAGSLGTPGTSDPGTAALRDLWCWAHRYRPTRRERLLLAAHRAPGSVYWRQLAGVLVIRGAGDRARYLFALIWPQRAYLEARAWSPRHHVRRAWLTLSGPIRRPAVATWRRIRRAVWVPGERPLRGRR
jgi:hypothetical protein